MSLWGLASSLARHPSRLSILPLPAPRNLADATEHIAEFMAARLSGARLAGIAAKLHG